VAVIRREKPQVIVTYGDDQQGYPHPDHIRVHDITVPAFDAAGDPDKYPEAGPPWQPVKLYYVAWARARVLAMHEKFKELGLESPFDDERWLKRPSQDHRITTRLDVGEHDEARRAGLLAHATQIDPESPFWFGLPAEAAREAYPYEDYELARSLVDSEVPEDDLFAGIPVRDRA
jgi:mycothiol S-conjugate amidase